jgi:hypothetical protein
MFLMAKSAKPSLDHEIFTYYLLDILAPALDGLNGKSPESIERVTDSLYTTILELLQKGFLGGSKKQDPFESCFKQFVLAFPDRIADRPDEFLKHITQALIQLCTTSGARPEEWTRLMIQCNPASRTYEELLQTGFAAAWRSGMAHYRKKAFQIIQNSTPEIIHQLLNRNEPPSPVEVKTIIENMSRNPWLTVEQAAQNIQTSTRLSIVAQAGGFTGFGGLFISPPSIRSNGEELVAICGEHAWTLFADCYGKVFLPSDGDSTAFINPKTDFNYYPNGTVSYGSYNAVFSDLSNANSFAALGGTFAVTIPYSHSIYLIAPVAP